MNKKILSLLILISIGINSSVFAIENKYPDLTNEFLGKDKWENVNRKIFKLNQNINKFLILPVHIIWSSVMPKYGMDRLSGISNNIEYPIRLASSIIQRDFKTAKNETVRFLTNSTVGLGGMFDPAKRFLGIEESDENMEQALAGCKIKSGPYFVAPIISFTTPRGILGKILDAAFNPSSYIGTPVLAIIKAGLTINRTAYLQPLINLVESSYADPYEIMKKVFGINNYIKCANYDRINVTSNLKVDTKDQNPENYRVYTSQLLNPPKQKLKKEKKYKLDVDSEILPNTFYVETDMDDLFKDDDKLYADIILPAYNPQSPVVDSMRTALFDVDGTNNSIWNELSVWNRSFASRIKTASVNIFDGREDYKFKYILQKDTKNSPLAIIYPSIGEGASSQHSVLLGKLFYDAGYSVVIQGSHFNWEFIKSMPEKYCPGMPAEDSEYLRKVTLNIIKKLENKYDCKFENKMIVGTSFGALNALFLADKESRENTLGNTKFISICPPIDLVYAMKQVDKNTEEWKNSSEELKDKTAKAASKVVKLYKAKDDIAFEVNNLPFDEDEGKLITGFVMHQKLSDVIFTIEKASENKNWDIYQNINSMNYQDYVEKYLAKEEGQTCDDLAYISSLASISDYLKNGKNYKIYHSLNDYLTNTEQLKNLKRMTGKKTVLVDNGAHLGFLYRQEFINHFKNTITTN